MVQWTLVKTNSLGPVKLLCYINILLYPGCKNNKIQRNFELWDQENYFVISGFCYISVLYNESPLYNSSALIRWVGLPYSLRDGCSSNMLVKYDEINHTPEYQVNIRHFVQLSILFFRAVSQFKKCKISWWNAQ